MINLFSAGVTLGIPHFLVDPIDVRGQQRQKQQEQRLTPCHTLLDRPTGKASFDPDEAREKTCPDLS